jgi:chromosome segregation ATPase
MNTKSVITATLTGILLAAPGYLAARQVQDSVADAARRAQAERKNAPKAKLSIDNDNLDTITGTVSVVGQEPAAPDDQKKKTAADQKAAGDKTPAKDEAYWRDKFADANKKLAEDSRELDILQREYNLKQEQFYQDPMAALKQDYSRSDLNDTRAKIDDKTAVVAQDKADISNLEDELRQAGGDPGWATPPAQPSVPAESSAPPQSAMPSPAQ